MAQMSGDVVVERQRQALTLLSRGNACLCHQRAFADSICPTGQPGRREQSTPHNGGRRHRRSIGIVAILQYTDDAEVQRGQKPSLRLAFPHAHSEHHDQWCVQPDIKPRLGGREIDQQGESQCRAARTGPSQGCCRHSEHRKINDQRGRPTDGEGRSQR